MPSSMGSSDLGIKPRSRDSCPLQAYCKSLLSYLKKNSRPYVLQILPLLSAFLSSKGLLKEFERVFHCVLICYARPLRSHHWLSILWLRIPIYCVLSNPNEHVSIVLVLLNIPVVLNTVHYSYFWNYTSPPYCTFYFLAFLLTCLVAVSQCLLASPWRYAPESGPRLSSGLLLLSCPQLQY